MQNDSLRSSMELVNLERLAEKSQNDSLRSRTELVDAE
jgi:hypothetical protein